MEEDSKKRALSPEQAVPPLPSPPPKQQIRSKAIWLIDRSGPFLEFPQWGFNNLVASVELELSERGLSPYTAPLCTPIKALYSPFSFYIWRTHTTIPGPSWQGSSVCPQRPAGPNQWKAAAFHIECHHFTGCHSAQQRRR